jgi:hypothetical protein
MALLAIRSTKQRATPEKSRGLVSPAKLPAIAFNRYVYGETDQLSKACGFPFRTAFAGSWQPCGLPLPYTFGLAANPFGLTVTCCAYGGNCRSHGPSRPLPATRCRTTDHPSLSADRLHLLSSELYLRLYYCKF